MTNENREIEIWLVDDEQQVLDATEFRLSGLGHKIRKFADPTLAEAEIENSKCLVLVILDHDFSLIGRPDYTGYNFSGFMKRTHWTRGACPIVYLTGRETFSNFNIQAELLGDLAPDSYLSKSSTAANPSLLLDAVGKNIHALEQFSDSIDEHGLEIAIGIYTNWSE